MDMKEKIELLKRQKKFDENPSIEGEFYDAVKELVKIGDFRIDNRKDVPRTCYRLLSLIKQRNDKCIFFKEYLGITEYSMYSLYRTVNYLVKYGVLFKATGTGKFWVNQLLVK